VGIHPIVEKKEGVCGVYGLLVPDAETNFSRETFKIGKKLSLK